MANIIPLKGEEVLVGTIQAVLACAKQQMFEYQAAYKRAAKGLQDTPALELSLLSEDLDQIRMEN